MQIWHRGFNSKETSKLAPVDKNVFEAEWIRGSYQLIVPALPAQERSVKPSMTNKYHMELQTDGCVNM